MECIFCCHKPCVCNHTEEDARNYGIELGRAGGNTDNPYSPGSTLYEAFKDGVVFGKSDNRLPGAMIMFATTSCTGSSEDQYGVGDMDLSLYRPGQKYPWIDLGRINYSHPTQSQYLAAENSEQQSTGWSGHDCRMAYSNIHRRVSKKQAEYINMLIREMLMKEFAGVIPPDDEIVELMKQRFPKGYV